MKALCYIPAFEKTLYLHELIGKDGTKYLNVKVVNKDDTFTISPALRTTKEIFSYIEKMFEYCKIMWIVER